MADGKNQKATHAKTHLLRAAELYTAVPHSFVICFPTCWVVETPFIFSLERFVIIQN